MNRDSYGIAVSGFINFVFGLAIIGLFFRFFLRLFGANPNADFVDFIYESTEPLLEPFRDVFNTYAVEPGNVLEFNTLFAIAVYAITAWLLSELVAFIVNANDAYTK